MTSKKPRLRSHTRKRKNGDVRTYWFYDMRHEGKPDIPLGHEYDEALKQYEELHLRKPRIAGTLQEAFDQFERECFPELSKKHAQNYAGHLRHLSPVFGPSTWDMVSQGDLWDYLKERSNKGLGKKEVKLLHLIWNCAMKWRMTKLANPAAGMRITGYGAREFEVTDALFDAVYAEAEPMLRDCMDLATATGMRLTDCRTVALPLGDVLKVKANKTGKKADFEVPLSQVLPALIERRRALPGALHTMLLSMPDGKPVTVDMLRGAFDRARAAAAKKAEESGDAEFAANIKAMYLRDCRKRAADLADSDEEASKLLQHSDVRTTRTHYRSKAVKLKPVR